jgi:hypothetical protein
MTIIPGITAPSVFHVDPVDKLAATVSVLHDIAEAQLDTQAALTDTPHRQWLLGYRAACKGILDAHELYREVRNAKP